VPCEGRKKVGAASTAGPSVLEKREKKTLNPAENPPQTRSYGVVLTNEKQS
jgi:hypothetical protein